MAEALAAAGEKSVAAMGGKLDRGGLDALVLAGIRRPIAFTAWIG